MPDTKKIVDVYKDYSRCESGGNIRFVKVINSDYVFRITNNVGRQVCYTVVEYYDCDEDCEYIKEECYFDTFKEAEEYAYGKHERNDDYIF